MPTRVSILVPCFNAAASIAEALESALGQSCGYCEVIVVNDGSTDASADVLERFVERGVQVIHQDNRGASAARNLAYSRSSGDYIQYLDADDVLSATKIERQLAVLGGAGSRYVASGPWARFAADRSDARVVEELIWRDLSAVDFLVECALQELMFPPVAWLIPRALCESAGPWNETLSMNDDGEFMSRVLAHADGIKFVDEALVYYRTDNPASYGSRRSRAAAQSELRAWESIVQTMVSLETSPRTAAAAATGYQRIQAKYYPQYRDLLEEAERKERAHGGGRYRFEGGALFRAVARLLGWRAAVSGRRVLAGMRRGATSGATR